MDEENKTELLKNLELKDQKLKDIHVILEDIEKKVKVLLELAKK